MRIRSRLPIAACIFFLVFAANAFAQSPDWVITPNGPNGLPIGAGAFDVPAGMQNPRHASALDGNGNLFIAGHYVVSAQTNPEGYGAFLGKYSAANGSELWHFTGAVPSALYAVAVNSGGDAFVVGYTVSSTIEHQYVARISGATGAVMWEAHDIPGITSENYGVDIVLDPAGNPVVMGAGGRATVTKYDANTGAVSWSVVPGADAAAAQHPFGIEADADGNIVGVAYTGDGSASSPLASLLFKLSGSDGSRIWATPWSWHSAAIPEIQGLALDGAGKPILVGKGIAKFSGVDGTLNWQRTLSETASNPSFAFGVTTDNTGDVFVSGAEDPGLPITVTAKFRSLDGSTRWHARLQSSSSKPNQFGKSITLDANQDPLAAARVFFDGSSTDYEIQTLNYSNDGVLWLMQPRFNVAAAGGSQGDADLELSFVQHAYTIGHYTRTSDGALVTVVLKYTEPRKVFSTASLAASPNPATLNAPVTLSATISGPAGTPTGTVDFAETTSTVQPIAGCQGVPLSNGTASCNAGTLTPGQHQLEVVYNGDAVYHGSAGHVVETVQNNQATVNIASSANPVAFQQPVTFTASVSGSAGTATGTVRFIDGGPSNVIFTCLSVALSNGAASCTLDGLMPGTHSISAIYSGDASYDAASSPAIAETVQGGPATPSTGWSVTTTGSPPPSLQIPTINTGRVGSASGVDAAGNLFAIGSTYASGSSNTCMVVIKYAAGDGSVAWRRDNCTAGTTFGASLGVDGSGNVLVTGAVAGDLYVAKLSGSTGTPMWERTIPRASSAPVNAGLGIGLDVNGNARVLGWEGSPITVYGISNADGSIQWQTPIDTGLGGAKAYSFAVDYTGAVALYERHTIDTRDNVADTITRLDPAGGLTWHVAEPGGESGLTFDNQGNVIGSSLSGLVKRDVVTGSVLWRQPFGGASKSDSQGNIYVASSVASGVDTPTDAFFAKIAPSGQVVWSRLLVDPNTSTGTGRLTFDADGNVLAVGVSFASGQAWQQTTYKVSSADGSLLWMATQGQPNVFYEPDGVFATPQGVATFGDLVASGGSAAGWYATLYGTAPAASPPRLMNISTRGLVQGGDDVLIGGFVIGGSTAKTVMIVATGPSLAQAGVSNPLADPTMTLVRMSDQSVVATNDNWTQAPNADAMRSTGFAPSDARESAILVTLQPGAYTAIVDGVNGATGVAVVAVYEVDHPDVPLINISTRGDVLTGNNVLIGGLVVTGDSPKTVVITATGPSLASAGVANALSNPTLTLVRSSDQAVIAANDDWKTASNADAIRASGFAPSNDAESAIMMTLPPGAYTAIVSGVGGATGIAVIGAFSTP